MASSASSETRKPCNGVHSATAQQRNELVDFMTPDARHAIAVSPLRGITEDWLHDYFANFGLVYSVKIVHESVALVRFYLASAADAAAKQTSHNCGQRMLHVRAARSEDRAWPRVPMSLGKCCQALEYYVGMYQLTAEPRPVAFLRTEEDSHEYVLRTRAILDIEAYDIHIMGSGFVVYDDQEEQVLLKSKVVVNLNEPRGQAVRDEMDKARVTPRKFKQLGEAIHNVFNAARVACFLQLRLIMRRMQNGDTELIRAYKDTSPPPCE